MWEIENVGEHERLVRGEHGMLPAPEDAQNAGHEASAYVSSTGTIHMHGDRGAFPTRVPNRLRQI